MPANSVIEQAREAARYSFKPGDTDTASPLLVEAFRDVAQRGGDYAMRVLLTELRKKRQAAPGEEFGHLISVVPVSVIDAFLTELGDE